MERGPEHGVRRLLGRPPTLAVLRPRELHLPGQGVGHRSGLARGPVGDDLVDGRVGGLGLAEEEHERSLDLIDGGVEIRVVGCDDPLHQGLVDVLHPPCEDGPVVRVRGGLWELLCEPLEQRHLARVVRPAQLPEHRPHQVQAPVPDHRQEQVALHVDVHPLPRRPGAGVDERAVVVLVRRVRRAGDDVQHIARSRRVALLLVDDRAHVEVRHRAELEHVVDERGLRGRGRRLALQQLGLQLLEERRLVVAQLGHGEALGVEEDTPVRLPHAVELHPPPLLGRRLRQIHFRLQVHQAALDEELDRAVRLLDP
jgi:hypothetical protein